MSDTRAARDGYNECAAERYRLRGSERRLHHDRQCGASPSAPHAGVAAESGMENVVFCRSDGLTMLSVTWT